MTLQSAVIPGFNNGISQQAATNRRPNQGELQVNALGTLVDGLMQRPGTNHLAVLTSNAANGVFAHGINRDTDEQFIVMFTGDSSEPIEIFDIAGVKQTVQFGTLNAAGEASSFSLDNNRKAYALPWLSTNLTVNGTFDADTDWDKGDGWTIAGEVADCDGTQVAVSELKSSVGPLTDAKTYHITFDVKNWEAGTVTPYLGDQAGTAVGASGSYCAIIVCDTTTDIVFEADADFHGEIDNVHVHELDTTSDPSEVFKAVTVADNTFLVNRGITVEINGAVNEDSLDYTVQTFADLEATPGDGEVSQITGDDVTGFDDWYVKYTLATDVWAETIAPGVNTGHFKDFSMPYRLVHTGATTFTFAPCIWTDREVGDLNSTPTPSFVNNVIQNVFFFKNRLAFLSEDKVIMSRTGEYFNFYTETALDVLDSDPIDVSATSKQVENLRSVAVFDKSLILLADQQQFDFGSGESALTPTTVAITPTTRFNICKLCEPVTAGPNVYFICPKTDFATVREYYIQPDSLLNDAADITAHVPNYVPMGHIQMAACNSLDMLLVHSDSNPDSIYLYKYFWAGEEKAQASWSRWDFDGDIYGMVIIGTIVYFILKNPDTGETCMESMELETTTSGDLGFRVFADRHTDVTGVYDSTLDKTTWTLDYLMAFDNDKFVVIHPTTGRPVVEAAIAPYSTTDLVVNGTFTGDTDWTKGSGWTLPGTVAACDGTQGAESLLTAAVAPLAAGTYRITYTLNNITAGDITPRLGTVDGVTRTLDGTYQEVIVSDGTSLNFAASDDFVGDVDNVKIYAYTATPQIIEVGGDLSAVEYHIAFQYEMRYRLTPWYLKNAQGAPLLQGRLQVRTLVLNFKDTGYYTVEVTPSNRAKTTHIFSGAIIGVSTLGEVNLNTGEERHTIKARNTGVMVDIVTDSYLPVQFQAGSWEGIYYPRGKES